MQCRLARKGEDWVAAGSGSSRGHHTSREWGHWCEMLKRKSSNRYRRYVGNWGSNRSWEIWVVQSINVLRWGSNWRVVGWDLSVRGRWAGVHSHAGTVWWGGGILVLQALHPEELWARLFHVRHCFSVWGHYKRRRKRIYKTIINVICRFTRIRIINTCTFVFARLQQLRMSMHEQLAVWS